MVNAIPEVVILRLPLYARALASLEAQGVERVSSQTLGSSLQVTSAQIRKDLSYFGRFGTQGRGYQVADLLRALRQILGLARQWSVVLVGVGQLGRAILSYGGFTLQGFHTIAAFDADPAKIGHRVGALRIQDIRELEELTRHTAVDIGIVAVPAATCQQIVDLLVQCGVRAILNYAPYQARVPAHVWIRDIDPVVALQSMTYHLKSLETTEASAVSQRQPELAASS